MMPALDGGALASIIRGQRKDTRTVARDHD
jgi:hypothetical protein